MLTPIRSFCCGNVSFEQRIVELVMMPVPVWSKMIPGKRIQPGLFELTMIVFGVNPFIFSARTTSIQWGTSLSRPLHVAPGSGAWHSIFAFVEVVSLPFWAISPFGGSNLIIISVMISEVIPAFLVPPGPNRSMYSWTTPWNEPHIRPFVGEDVFPSAPGVCPSLFLVPWPDNLLIPCSTVRTGYWRDWSSKNRICRKLRLVVHH